MKNISKSLIALFAIVAVACSTDDVEDRPIIQGIDAPVLAAPDEATTYILLPENMDMQAERFVWSEANYGGDIAVTYEVQMDVEGGDFSSPQVLGGANSTNQVSVSVETMNNAALALGAAPYETSSFLVRVKSSANGAEPMFSNVVPINITPYTTESPKVYVVGNFQGASGYGNDWTPADGVPLEASGFGMTDFEGYVYMNVATPEFKILPTNTGWEGDYGDDGSFSGGLAQEGESNIELSAPGYYRITANTTTLVYAVTPTNWAVVGSATSGGWDNDTDMTYNPDTKQWTVTLNLTGGQEIKFRANDGWDLNFGDDGNDGNLEQGGANIAVAESGNYTVMLDLSNPRNYTYSITAN